MGDYKLYFQCNDKFFRWHYHQKMYLFQEVEKPELGFPNYDFIQLGVIHKPRGQEEVGGWLVKCPRLST